MQQRFSSFLTPIALLLTLTVLVACGGAPPTVPDTDTTLSVTVAGDGGGTVTSAPAGIDVTSGTDTATFAASTQVTLTATATAGSSFQGWTGACAGAGSNTCVITMDSNTSTTATFVLGEADSFTLTVSVTGEGQGSVTSSPSGIDAATGETDMADFDEGTAVTLTAAPAVGLDFLGWGGGSCSGFSTTCVVTMNADTTVSASFGVMQGAAGEFNILTGADDAQEYAENISESFPAGSVDATSSDLDLTWDTAVKPGTSEARGLVTIGLRYQNVDIPQGATITSATITFTRRASGSGTPTLVIRGHADDNTPAFVHGGNGTATFGISSRATTAASLEWTTPGTEATMTTPDLANVVQQIVDRPGWTSGNALGFTITSPNSSASNFRRADSFETTGGTTPVLTIVFETATD
ncbi:MAG: hypothetical protein H0U69_02575 [Trueperaceae bacterium]|nr:hypothetical protein [Trueperaceae bacterium]